MISTETFRANENRMELISNDPNTLPCICKYVDFENYVGNRVPWHWHQRFEINYLIEGTTSTRVGDQVYIMNPGDALFVNYNVLHAVDPVNGCYPKYYTFFFDMDFLTGGFNTIYSRKYVIPISSSTGLRSYMIRSGSAAGVGMLWCLTNLIELFDKEPFGFEFKIRSCLSDFWLMLFEATAPIRAKSSTATSVDDSRLRSMMEFIENNYPDKIMLDDIAGSVGISNRECTRCFSKVLGQSPMNYLNAYRIRQAAGMLVESDMSIGMIAEKCGFISDSYFGKIFRETMGCTPRDYRKGRNLSYTLPTAMP